MEGSFCLPIEVQEEGAICDLTDVTRPCIADLLCFVQEGAPRCNQAATECPDGWMVRALHLEPGLRADDDNEVNRIQTGVCAR